MNNTSSQRQNNGSREDKNNAIVLTDGSRLEWLEKSYKIFLNKMTIIYGPSGSGKTTILNEIMYLLKPHIPHVWVISPTNFANKMFVGKVAPHCIKPGTDVTKTIQFLEKLLSHQRNVKNLYEMSNDIEILESIFKKIFDTRASSMVNQIRNDASRFIQITNGMRTLNIAERKVKILDIEKKRDNMLRRIYKACITKHKSSLDRDTLTEQENVAIKFININPRCLLILDDCASRFKEWVKKSSTIKQIFYEFRNYGGSTCITAQNDKEIDSEYRKNAMVNIFTDDQSAVSNFTRPSNSYSKHTKEKAMLCINAIYSQTSRVKHYKKLVYFNNSSDPFRYTQADLYNDFRMGCSYDWLMSKKISEKNEESEEINPYFERYRR